MIEKTHKSNHISIKETNKILFYYYYNIYILMFILR